MNALFIRRVWFILFYVHVQKARHLLFSSCSASFQDILLNVISSCNFRVVFHHVRNTEEGLITFAQIVLLFLNPTDP